MGPVASWQEIPQGRRTKYAFLDVSSVIEGDLGLMSQVKVFDHPNPRDHRSRLRAARGSAANGFGKRDRSTVHCWTDGGCLIVAEPDSHAG